MKKLVKITTAAILFSLIISTNCSAFAQQKSKQENIKTTKITFNEEKYSNLTLVDKGKHKLLDSNYTDTYINSLSNDVLEDIGNAVSGQQATLYFKESGTDNNGNPILKQVNKGVYDKIQKETVDDYVRNYAKNISVIDKDGNVVYKPIKFKSANTLESDGGTLKLTNTIYKLKAGPSAYLMAGQFIWTKMPSYRGKDFYGFVRDTNTVEVPGYFHSIMLYTEQDYMFLAGNYGVTHTKYGDPIKHQKDDIPNNAGENHNAYTMEMNLPSNLMPPAQMLQGSSFIAKVYYGLQGGVQYGQALKQPSIMPQNFNIWLTYLHEKGWKIQISPPSINIPATGGFSITPYFESVYDTVIREPFLLTWDK